MDCSTWGFLVLHYLWEFAQTHVHWVDDTIQPSHLLLPLLFLPSIFPIVRVFSSESPLCMSNRILLSHKKGRNWVICRGMNRPRVCHTEWNKLEREKQIPYINTYIASLVAQMVKNLPAMWETRVWSLGGEDPLEKEMATHSSILAWRIPWTEEPSGLLSIRLQTVRHDWVTKPQSNAYMWNLENWYRWTYFQGKKRDTNMENGHVDTVGEGEDGTNWESNIAMYTLPSVK